MSQWEEVRWILRHRGESYISHFLTVKDIRQIVDKVPARIDSHLVELLEKILRDRRHDRERLSIFLFRECAEVLANIAIKGRDGIRERAYNILKSFSRGLLNTRSLPCSMALGMFPCNINTYSRAYPAEEIKGRPYPLPERGLLLKRVLGREERKHLSCRWMGRSCVYVCKEKVVVFKVAKNPQDVEFLKREVIWMHHLRDMGLPSLRPPMPVEIKGHFVFSSPEGIMPFICFVVDRDYFIYPNGNGLNNTLPQWEEFLKIIGRGSYLLGLLAGKGIIHTSPIPLFHNRIQAERRNDRGIYLWERGGRLDRWLSSCMYPNIGKSGIRDLEHLEFYQGNQRDLFRHLGNHILSMILILGSYFRMKDPTKMGYEKDGSPCDVRHLFSHQKMKEGVIRIIKKYFHGFVGEEVRDINFDHITQFVQKLIEEMGVDRHMQEFLRTQDQEQMSEKEFKEFLLSHGYGEEEITNISKGERDIPLTTGPHLGEFNGRISIPEVIPFVAGVAGMNISSRYLKENHLHGSLSYPR